jgi:hypothetical protein
MAKKTAMVQTPPIGAVREPPSLEQVLERLGNDRAYTVISHKGSTWVVHFEGDAAPITITADTK